MPDNSGYPGTISGGEGKHGATRFDRDNVEAAKREGNMSADTKPVGFGSRTSVKKSGPSHTSGRANYKRGGTDDSDG